MPNTSDKGKLCFKAGVCINSVVLAGDLQAEISAPARGVGQARRYVAASR